MHSTSAADPPPTPTPNPNLIPIPLLGDSFLHRHRSR
jgi:hypothetical protein